MFKCAYLKKNNRRYSKNILCAVERWKFFFVDKPKQKFKKQAERGVISNKYN